MEKAKGVKWDLSFLYNDVNDPAIDEDLKLADKLADKFVKEYRGKIKSADMNAATLLKAIEDLENVYKSGVAPYHFASLKFSENTQDPKNQQILGKVQQTFTQINNKLVFFNVELMEMPEKTADAIILDPAFEAFKWWLKEARKSKPYTLSEKEEQVINLKDSTGSSAFVQLYEEYTGDFEFEMEIDGENKKMTGEEISSYFSHKDRDVRKNAYDAFYAVYKCKVNVITSILNTLLRDHYNETKLRNWPSAMAPAYLRDQVSQETIDNLMNVVEKNYKLAQRYYVIKKKILGFDELHGWDRSAPVGQDYKMNWDEAHKLVVDSYSAFDPVL